MKKDFINVSPSSGGEGSLQIAVSATENLEAGNRQVEIKISGGGVTRSVSISQKAYRTEVVAEINPKNYTFPPSGGIKEFKCTCVRNYYDASGTLVKSEPMLYNTDWEIGHTEYLGTISINPETQVCTVTADPANSDMIEEVGVIQIFSMEDGSELASIVPMIEACKEIYITCYDEVSSVIAISWENITTRISNPFQIYVFSSVQYSDGWATEKLAFPAGEHSSVISIPNHVGFAPEGISEKQSGEIKQEMYLNGYHYIFKGNSWKP